MHSLRALIFCAAACAAFGQTSPFCNVKQFGAAGNGTTLDTEAINKAVDACARSGGGTVYVPAGTYLSGTVMLKDNITLLLDAGATLLGTEDLKQYRTAVDGQDWYQALVLAKGVHHVAVMGRGVIDGNKVFNPNGEEHIRGPHAVMFYDVEDLSVKDITVRNSSNYAVIVRKGLRINIDGITVQGGWDGVNMHDAKDATISNCRLYTGDDSLAGAYWENVTVTNCILNASANGIRVGGRNVLIQNCVIYGPGQFAAGSSLRHRLEAGFQILPNQANVTNKYAARGPVDNMVLSGITMINVGTPVFVAYSGDAPYSNGNLGVGRIIIEDLTVLQAGKTPFYVSAPPSNPARSIVLNNVRMMFIGGSDEAESQFQGFSPFSILQSYGIYCRNVDHLELNNVRIGFDAKDLRPAVFGDNIRELELNGFQADRDPAGAPELEGAHLGTVSRNGNVLPKTTADVTSIDVPSSPYANQPFAAIVTVRNSGGEGLAHVDLKLPGQTVSRDVWLHAGQVCRLWFLNLRIENSGEKQLSAGTVSKSIVISSMPPGHDVESPYRTAKNTSAEFRQYGANSFYIRAAGDHPVMQQGDQYGAVYLPKALGRSGSVTVKLENPDLRTNWVGRAGIIVRGDIGKPGQAGAHVAVTSSPAAGSYLEWESHGTGLLDQHSEFSGYTVWPHWLKLERQGNEFTGYCSRDGKTWEKIAEADLPDTPEQLDAGMFAYRDSALFEDFKVSQ